MLKGHVPVVVESIRYNSDQARWEWTARDPERGEIYFGTESPIMYRPGELNEGDRAVILFYRNPALDPPDWHILVSEVRAKIILSEGR